jgi:hypothetical protein
VTTAVAYLALDAGARDRLFEAVVGALGGAETAPPASEHKSA